MNTEFPAESTVETETESFEPEPASEYTYDEEGNYVRWKIEFEPNGEAFWNKEILESATGEEVFTELEFTGPTDEKNEKIPETIPAPFDNTEKLEELIGEFNARKFKEIGRFLKAERLAEQAKKIDETNIRSRVKTRKPGGQLHYKDVYIINIGKDTVEDFDISRLSEKVAKKEWVHEQGDYMKPALEKISKEGGRFSQALAKNGVYKDKETGNTYLAYVKYTKRARKRMEEQKK